MSVKLGGFAVLLASSFLMFSCEEERSEPVYTLTFVEAPTRLPYDTDGQSREGEDGYDTIAVRFSVALSPPADEIDTIFCTVLDEQQFEVADILLFDDGNLSEHHGTDAWQEPYTGDSAYADFIYSGRVIPADRLANYAGARYTFLFAAGHEGATYAQVSYVAETWVPSAQIEQVTFSEEEFTLCTDSVVVELELTRDPTDIIDSVHIGRMAYYDGGLASPATLAAVSGDTLWRGVIRRDSLSFYNWDNESFGLEVFTRLGYPTLHMLAYYLELNQPQVDTSLIADSVVLGGATTEEPVIMTIGMVTCAEDGWIGPAGAEFTDWSSEPEFPLTFNGNRIFNDCGEQFDESEGDGLFTGAFYMNGSQLHDTIRVNLEITSGLDEDDHCESNYYMIDSTFSVTVFVLPAAAR
ncbi:hypothetical protein IT157_07760 [bacterium]|nr:hypothetical protein [bacterium]